MRPGRTRIEKGIIVLALLAMSVSGSAASSAGPAVPHSLVAHAPIRIEGDSGFTAAQGVVGGAGTPEDPYVIEGWEIDLSATDGIAVRDTTMSLLIRNVSLHRSGELALHNGIDLFQVHNVRIENVTALAAAWGVGVRSSTNVSVGRSSLLRNGVGIRVADSGLVTAFEDEIRADGYDSYVSVYVEDSDRIALLDNRLALDMRFFGNGMHEVQLDNVTNVTLQDNVIGTDQSVPDGAGIWMVDVFGAALRNNTFLSRGISPSPITGSSEATFRRGREIFDSYTITPDNTINGRPIVFRNRCTGDVLDRIVAGEIILANCVGARISNVTLQNPQVGLVLAYSTQTLVTYNRFVDAVNPLIVFESGVHAYHNDFFRFGPRFWVTSDALPIRFDAGYPAGGNYYSFLARQDRCSGILQDVCPDSDGILDSAQPLLGDSVVDRYPLANPINGTNTWPTARVRVETADADVYTPITFDATGVSDREDSSDLLQVRWDFDRDGRWDTNWSREKIVAHIYPAPGPHSVLLEVRDSGGLLSSAAVIVQVAQFNGWRAAAVYVGVPVIVIASVVAGILIFRRYRMSG